MKKLKIVFSCLLLLCLLSTDVLALGAQAKNSEVRISEDIVVDADFFKEATLDVKKPDRKSTVFTLTKCEPVLKDASFGANSISLDLNNGEQLYRLQSMSIFAKGEKEASDVRAQLSSAELDYHLPPGGYFNGSLTMYVKVYFYKKNLPGYETTFYKLTKATAYATVRNGTSIVRKELAFNSCGITEDGNFYPFTAKRYDVTNEINISRYAPTIWPYVSPGGIGNVGAALTCEVKRPSGERSIETHSVALPNKMS